MIFANLLTTCSCLCFFVLQALNALFEEWGLGIEVISGHIGSITVSVPWNSLLKKDSFVEVHDLSFTMRPLPCDNEDGASMIESMWSSRSSTMQMAQECLSADDIAAAQQAELASTAMDGLERFAQIIDGSEYTDSMCSH